MVSTNLKFFVTRRLFPLLERNQSTKSASKKVFSSKYSKPFKKRARKSKQKQLCSKIVRFKRKYRFMRSVLSRNYLFISKYAHKFILQVHIRISFNNIFCTLRDIVKNQILLNLSCGILKLDTSKKKLNYNIKFVLETFFKKAELSLKTKKNCIVQIISPKKFRKKILGILKQRIKRKNIILRTKKNKCFNGCRSPKKRRKKRVSLRVLV